MTKTEPETAPQDRRDGLLSAVWTLEMYSNLAKPQRGTRQIFFLLKKMVKKINGEVKASATLTVEFMAKEKSSS